MRVLLTGANGYLGGWVSKLLVDSGHGVKGLTSHISEHELDVLPDWADAIIHLGWYSSVGDSDIHSECLASSINLQRMSRGKPIVFASTAAVYGDCGGEYVGEDSLPVPADKYSAAKLEAEGVMACSLRLGTLMGTGAPGCRTKTDTCINAFAVDAFNRGRVDVWNPDCYKPVVHVMDAAQIFVWAVERGWTGIYNVASTSRTAGDLALLVAETAGLDGRNVVIVDPRTAARSCRMEFSKLVARLGAEGKSEYSPRTVHQSSLEFAGFAETPDCRNQAWRVRHG